MKARIWLSPPHLSGREKELVEEAFASNWVAPLGPHVDAFERELCTYTGAGYAAALSSGTAALHLALILCGVERGHEVICQSFTFAASANPIVYQGATPVFVDSEPDTWNMCPHLLEEAIKDRLSRGRQVKAVVAVHLYGMPAKTEDILNVCRKYDIPLIEDAAEALGSRRHGKACGTQGRFGVLSFNGNKIITTSGGGALLSEDEAAIQKARFLATQARDPAPHYEHSHIGYNYRMSNVLAAIGRGQLETLEDKIRARRAHFERYRRFFEDVEGVKFQPEVEGNFSNRWLTCILVDAGCCGFDREMLRLAMEAENIECRPLWKPMHLQPVFRDAPRYGGSVSERLFRDGLCLPSGSGLTEEEWERIEETLGQVVHKSRNA
ncbi:MAG: aminotransferase class I/II-fold pyridoxal phosphate-dependent enzyme [Flavobacteriales bacterium]|nr:aminotransferase class I/II-fold pyridoxal phosphate-dependent enzyme [Flavobacteriales bacterium]MCX7767701.1 aminotransferase class I/II-fold pyridoxal phosphate-dependent enzyme [Flavobacteriales bacterium]MDW8409404.1 aminotransferase class I/II-fold pyridoxal phosphate-dependent enzyme [Flavobacteriales bacterium]